MATISKPSATRRLEVELVNGLASAGVQTGVMRVDGPPGAPAFTLTCPSGDSPDREVAAIRARGNLPLIIDGNVLAEIDRCDLVESWETAARLPAAEIAKMSRIAGERLTQVFAENLGSADLAEMVTDAAVLFLLSMRKNGVRTPDEIKPCTLLWDDEAQEEHLLVRA
jgi:hypothetical protein